MFESVATTGSPKAVPIAADTSHAFRVAIVAERLLQARSVDASASLDQLGRATRQRYEDVAAIALALLDDDGADRPALYAAADDFMSLSAQTPTQRVELVGLVDRLVDRYHAVLAGHHRSAVTRLLPLIDVDARAGGQ